MSSSDFFCFGSTFGSVSFGLIGAVGYSVLAGCNGTASAVGWVVATWETGELTVTLGLPVAVGSFLWLGSMTGKVVFGNVAV